MTDYKTLLAKKAELDAQIAAALVERKAEGIAMAHVVIAEYGLDPSDVFPPVKEKAAGSVGVAKYRDPATGVTWTGRGKPPNWILGKDRTPFLISSS